MDKSRQVIPRNAGPTGNRQLGYRFYFNIPRRLEEDFLTEGSWEAQVDLKRAPKDHDRIVISLDGSGTSGQGDTTAVIGCTISNEPYIFVIGNWPEKDGDYVNVLDVENRIRDYSRMYKVVEIVADPARWQRTLQVFESEGFEVLDYPQTDNRLMPATVTFRQAVQGKTVFHDGNLKLAQHLVHASVKESSRGARLFKPTGSSPLKIDLAIAAVMALDRAMWHNTNTTNTVGLHTGTEWLASRSPEQMRLAQAAADKRIQDLVDRARAQQAERMKHN